MLILRRNGTPPLCDGLPFKITMKMTFCSISFFVQSLKTINIPHFSQFKVKVSDFEIFLNTIYTSFSSL